jgi:hypothetical protein
VSDTFEEWLRKAKSSIPLQQIPKSFLDAEINNDQNIEFRGEGFYNE